VSENPGEAFERHMREPDPVPKPGTEEHFESFREFLEELFGVDAHLVELVPGEPEPGEPEGFVRMKMRGPQEMIERVHEEIIRRSEEQEGGGE